MAANDWQKDLLLLMTDVVKEIFSELVRRC